MPCNVLVGGSLMGFIPDLSLLTGYPRLCEYLALGIGAGKIRPTPTSNVTYLVGVRFHNPCGGDTGCGHS